MTRQLILLSLTLPVFGAACASTGSSSTAAPSRAVAAAGEPDAAELRRDLFAFAADSFRGRETGTPDADHAARFLAARLASLGLEPAGDSGFFQRVPLNRAKLTATTLAVTRGGSPVNLSLGPDVAVLGSLGPGAPLPKLDVDADIVFGGYGIEDQSLGRNDLAGLNLAGKAVVVIADAPPGADSATRAKFGGSQGINARLQTLLFKQPAAVVLVIPDSLYRIAATEFTGESVALKTAQAVTSRLLPMVAIAPLRPQSPFVPANPTTAQPGPLAGAHFTAKLEEKSGSFNGYNVVGIARGGDASMKGTYVAFGAHYDHVGVGAPVNGDSIYNGADDDGSGSMALLALARAWVGGPKQPRSALFVWHIGEEKGLLGSQYYTDHSTVPIDSIVAQLNADMVGRNNADSLYIVGPLAAPNGQSRVLGTLVDSANATLAHRFTFDRTWDSPSHPERIYFRSDHFNYARKGIPIIFFTTGLHPQYHQPSDEPSLIDYEKMARVAQLMYRTGVIVAKRASRPK
jgi:hypothetical protein